MGDLEAVALNKSKFWQEVKKISDKVDNDSRLLYYYNTIVKPMTKEMHLEWKKYEKSRRRYYKKYLPELLKDE